MSFKKINYSPYDALSSNQVNAIQDEILRQGKELTDHDHEHFLTGSYTGTGTHGSSNPTVINCGRRPKIMFVFIDGAANTYGWGSGSKYVLWVTGVTTMGMDVSGDVAVHFTETDTGLKFYATGTNLNDNSTNQMNTKNQKYKWVAIY